MGNLHKGAHQRKALQDRCCIGNYGIFVRKVRAQSRQIPLVALNTIFISVSGRLMAEQRLELCLAGVLLQVAQVHAAIAGFSKKATT